MRDFRWNYTPSEAIALQRELARRVVCSDDALKPRFIGGVDVSTTRDRPEGFAAVVVLSWPDLALVEIAEARLPLAMPYIPGLLSFREVPIALAAYEQLKQKPDLLIVDGQGRAHPRRFGVACHLGVLLETPTIGCAKSILVGHHPPLPPERGQMAPLIHHDEIVGYALRTKDRVNPVFVSCGNRISLESAVRWVLDCARGYRLPEPTRQAHLASNAFRRRFSS